MTEYDASDMQESSDDDFETKSLNSHFPLAESYLSYFSRMQPQSRDLGKWVGPQGSVMSRTWETRAGSHGCKVAMRPASSYAQASAGPANWEQVIPPRLLIIGRQVLASPGTSISSLLVS